MTLFTLAFLLYYEFSRVFLRKCCALNWQEMLILSKNVKVGFERQISYKYLTLFSDMDIDMETILICDNIHSIERLRKRRRKAGRKMYSAIFIIIVIVLQSQGNVNIQSKNNQSKMKKFPPRRSATAYRKKREKERSAELD